MMESVAPDNPILVIKLMLLVWVDHRTKLEVGSVMNAAGGVSLRPAAAASLQECLLGLCVGGE